MSSTIPPTFMSAPQTITTIKNTNNQSIIAASSINHNLSELNGSPFNPSLLSKIKTTETSPTPPPYAHYFSSVGDKENDDSSQQQMKQSPGFTFNSTKSANVSLNSSLFGFETPARINNSNVSETDSKSCCKHEKIKRRRDSFIDAEQILKNKCLTTPIKSVIKRTSRDIIKECVPSLYPEQVYFIKSEPLETSSDQDSIISMDIEMKDEEEQDEELEEVENLDIYGRKKTPITKSPAPVSRKRKRRYTFQGRDVFKIKE